MTALGGLKEERVAGNLVVKLGCVFGVIAPHGDDLGWLAGGQQFYLVDKSTT